MILGLAGGIASGKTEVARVFQKLGAIIISGDDLGREVVEKDQRVWVRLVETFGRKILNSNGTLNRRKLGQLAFSSPVSRKKLNRIVHPSLLRLMRQRVTYVRRQNRKNPIVIDAALLVEWKIPVKMDKLIVVHASRNIRVRRLRKKDLTLSEIRDRMRSQLPFSVERKHADIIIRNDGTLEELRQKAREVWNQLIRSERGRH